MAAPAVELNIVPVAMRAPRSLWKDAWWQFRRHRLAMIALVTLVFLILFTLIIPRAD